MKPLAEFKALLDKGDYIMHNVMTAKDKEGKDGAWIYTFLSGSKYHEDFWFVYSPNSEMVRPLFESFTSKEFNSNRRTRTRNHVFVSNIIWPQTGDTVHIITTGLPKKLCSLDVMKEICAIIAALGKPPVEKNFLNYSAMCQKTKE